MTKQNKQQKEETKIEGYLDKVINFERDTSANIYQRLHEVMKDVWYVKKKQKSGGAPYSTVEHDDVTNKVRPSLVKHGVMIIISNMQSGELHTFEKMKYDKYSKENVPELNFYIKSEFDVEFINIDNPEDRIKTPTFGIAMDNNPMTLSGKVISYGSKLAILKTLSLETGEQEDVFIDEKETDENAAILYNTIGKELFGDDWKKIGRKKIYELTKGQTADAERAPSNALNAAIKNLYQLKKKKEEEPDSDIKKINKEVGSKKPSDVEDILKDFED